jgi:hypothetical protein
MNNKNEFLSNLKIGDLLRINDFYVEKQSEKSDWLIHEPKIVEIVLNYNFDPNQRSAFIASFGIFREKFCNNDSLYQSLCDKFQNEPIYLNSSENLLVCECMKAFRENIKNKLLSNKVKRLEQLIS